MILLPAPRRIDLTQGVFALPRAGYVQLFGDPAELTRAARVLQRAARDLLGCNYSLVVAGPDDDVVIDILLTSQLPHDQGYEIEIEPAGIHMTAASAEAAFYAVQTLVQIIRQHPDGRLPCLQIEDRPDFRSRGVMLDISRDKVPTMATLRALVDELAALKINQLQLYTEHTFAYRNHPAVWAQASPMTGDQILELDRYCKQRFVELVPNQNSFGHMERWLKLPAYRDLAEAPDGFTFPWGVRHAGGFTLNPLDPRSIELIEGMYDELLPHFSSPLFNVGCDETFDLGLGRSKEQCDREGKGRLYVDFLTKIHHLVQDHGRLMMFWGDVILNHPELIDELPRDVVALEWGYEAGHPFEDHLARFEEAGLPVFVCPGTSSWCSITGRTDNALANLLEAARAGVAHDAAGYLITDWGDLGHHQPLTISLLPYAAGAAYAWNVAANQGIDIAAACDAHVFRDPAGVMGRLTHDLGNVYRHCREPLHNGSRLFWTLIGGAGRRNLYEGVTAAEYAAAEADVAETIARLGNARMGRPDAALVAEEFQFAADLLAHACQRGRFLLDNAAQQKRQLSANLESLTERHRQVWLRRNRQGGLADSVARLTTAANAYA